jgi:hypothetical protein
MLGPYTSKEHKSFVECCTHGARVNRSLHEMGVSYEPRTAPLEPSKRGNVSGNVSSDESAVKKSKKEATSGVGSTSAQVVLGKPPRVPTFKLAVDRAEAQKKKVSEASKYSFRIADSDIGS